MRNLQHRWMKLTPGLLFGADGEEDESDEPQEGADNEHGEDDDKPTEDKYSQAYVDKLRQEAAKNRVANKETGKELEAAKRELADLKKAEMSDLEAAKTDLDEASELLEEAQESALQANSALKTERIRNAVTMAALEAGFEDPSDALSMISQDDLVNDDGDIVAKTVKARLKSLADKKPYLLKSHRPGSGDGGGRGKPGGKQTFEDKEDAFLKTFVERDGRVVI